MNAAPCRHCHMHHAPAGVRPVLYADMRAACDAARVLGPEYVADGYAGAWRVYDDAGRVLHDDGRAYAEGMCRSPDTDRASAAHIVRAVNAMREALEELIAVEESVTTEQERGLRADWLLKARAALQDASRAAIEAAEAFGVNPFEEPQAVAEAVWDAAHRSGQAARGWRPDL